jgi:alpha-glucosidase
VWNKLKFYDVEKFTESLEKLKINLTVNIKPGILTSHPFYSDLNQNNFFV